jgi:hypothetical protein
VLLASLQGCCFTTRLWQDDAESPEPSEELVVERSDERELTAECRLDDDALWVRASDGSDRQGGSHWRLVAGQQPATVSELAAATALLAEPTLRVELVRDHEQGHLTYSSAQVMLTGVPVPAALGVAVDPASLPGELRQRLDAAVAGRPGFAFDVERGAGTPLLRRCRDRLQGLDLRPLAGDPAPPALVVLAAVFLDRDGRPWSPPDAADAAEPEPNAALDEAAIAARLAGVQAVVRASDGTGERTFVLELDRVWVWSALRRQPDGRAQHLSRWVGADAAAGQPVAAAAAWRGQLLLRERDLGWHRPGAVDHDSDAFWTRLALTPLALAGDVLVGWALSCLGVPVCGCDDDDDEQERRREQQRQQARRR